MIVFQTKVSLNFAIFYWKNIIPKNFTFENLTNVQVKQSNNPMDGARVPRTSYQKVIIN